MGEIGKSPHVQSRKQALAIAYSKERGRAEGGAVAGLVNHDNDPELPRTPEPAEMVPMMPLPRGYRDPAYIDVIQRLLEGQKRLNQMHPMQREQLRRYAIGGVLRYMRGGAV